MPHRRLAVFFLLPLIFFRFLSSEVVDQAKGIPWNDELQKTTAVSEKKIKRVPRCEDLVELELETLRAQAAGEKSEFDYIGNRLAEGPLDDVLLSAISNAHKKAVKVTHDAQMLLEKRSCDINPNSLRCAFVEMVNFPLTLGSLITELKIRLREKPCALTQLLIDVLWDLLERMDEQLLRLKAWLGQS